MARVWSSWRALPGPNVYMYRPALHATLELDELTEKESTDFPGFTERLLTVVQTLRLQKRAVLDYLASSLTALRSQQTPPPLLAST